MDLSVVVLSWNTSALTVRALQTASQGAGDLHAEVICVDNASTDDSVACVGTRAPHARVLVNGSNLGFAAGNNRALFLLRGRYTCFLNSDCAPGHGSLAHVVRWLDRHPRVGIAAPRLVGPGGRPQVVARREPRLLDLLASYTALRLTPLGRRLGRAWRQGEDAALPTEVASVTGACLVIRTDLLRRLGGFDEGYRFYWEDVDLCRRARDQGWRVAWVPDGPTVLHEGGGATAAGGGPPRLSFARGAVRYQRLHGDGPLPSQVFAYLFVLGVFVRALVEPGLLGVGGARRWLQGRRQAARSTWVSATSWLRLVERDSGDLLGILRSPR